MRQGHNNTKILVLATILTIAALILLSTGTTLAAQTQLWTELQTATTNPYQDANEGLAFDFNYTRLTIDGNIMPTGELYIPDEKLPAGGLVGYWKLDQNLSAVATDLSGQGNNGTWTNGPDLNGTSPFDDNAGYFDGANDYIDLEDVDATEGTTTLTISAWVKNNKDRIGDTGSETIINKQGGGTDSYTLYWDNTEDIIFIIKDSGDTSVVSRFTDGIPVGEGDKWHHIVGVYNGTDIKVYVDGILGETIPPHTEPINNTTHILTIGKIDNGEGWQGLIDEVRIYDRALNLSEIHTLYAAGLNDLNVSVRVCDDPSCQGLNDGNWAEFDVGNRYQSLDANVGLVLDINFNDTNTGGNGVLDASPYGNDGLLINGADINSLGKDNTRSGFFDGVDDYVGFGDLSEVEDTLGLTVSAWVKTPLANADSGNKTIVGKAGSGSDTFFLFWNSNENVSFDVRNTSNVLGTGTFPDGILNEQNIWKHIVGVHDGTNVKVYIDGEVGSTVGSLAGPTQNSTLPIMIGADSDAGSLWNGQIDNVKIWNRALSEGEVQGLYIKGSPMKYVQYRAEFDHQDANYPTGYGYLNDVGLEYNRVPDANVGAIDGYDAQEGLPIFSYETDGNLTMDFNVFDWDGNNGMVAEFFYSTNRGYGGSTKIQGGLKLADICTKMDFNTFDKGQCNWDWDISALSDANYYAGVTVIDEVGNTDYNLTTYSFAIDGAGPTTTENVTADGNSSWQNTDANIQFSCTDTTASCGNLYYSLDDVNYQKGWGTDLNIGLAITTDGNHEIFFWSSDTKDNNETAKLIYLALDKTAPTVTITDPTNPSSQNATTVTLTYTGTDTNSDVNKYWVKADSGNWIDNGTTLTYTFSSQTRSAHTYYLKATDNADNNSSEASVAVTINALPSTTTTPEGPGGPIGSTGLGTTPVTSTPATPEQIEDILAAAGLSQAQIEQALEANNKLQLERTIKVEKESTLLGISVYKTIVTIKATSLHNKTMTKIRIIENIPKGTVQGQLTGPEENKANLAEISSKQVFTVLKENQILEFIIERLEPNGTAIINYTINNRIMQTENWPAPVAANYQETIHCQGIECPQQTCKNPRCNPQTGRCNYSNQEDGMRCGQNGECEEGNCVEKPLPPQPPTRPPTETDLTMPITVLAIIGLGIAAGLGINYYKGKKASFKPKRKK